MAKNEIFDFTIQFQNDLIFTEIISLRYCILHAITANMDLSKNMIDRQDIDLINGKFANAGNFFNNALISNSIKCYTNEEFYAIASTLKADLSKSSKFAFLANKFQDPIKCFIYFTKYLIVPVRLDFNTIPEDKQYVFAKLWLTCISILIKLDSYTSKFMDAIPTLDTYHSCMNQVFAPGNNIIDALKRIDVVKIEGFITKRFDPNHKLSIFYIVMMKLIFHISVEIIKKFCPNYNICANSNPKYDGSWLSPFDLDVNTQINKLEDCIIKCN